MVPPVESASDRANGVPLKAAASVRNTALGRLTRLVSPGFHPLAVVFLSHLV